VRCGLGLRAVGGEGMARSEGGMGAWEGQEERGAHPLPTFKCLLPTC